MMNNGEEARILSVDDDPTFLSIISYYLEKSGYTVFKAKNGDEALDLFDEVKPDIVLCDLYMPGMSGLELIELLKIKSPDTPVIVISGEGNLNDAISAMRLGAWDYIVKPFEQAALDQTVKRVLDKFFLINENKLMKQQLEEKNHLLTQGFEQLQADQKAGEIVQNLLLPKNNITINKYDISYKIMPSLYLSGDFIDYFKLNQDTLAFYIADVSGHGASSAFVTVFLKGIMSQLLTNYQNGVDDIILEPDHVLKYISDRILSAQLGKYITMIYCVLDLKENLLHYSIGGHYPNPVIWDGKKACFLEGKGFAVGIYNNATFENNHIELPEEFKILMLSDGILELLEGGNLNENESLLLTSLNQKQFNIDKFLHHFDIIDECGFPDDITVLLIGKSDNHSSLSSPLA